MNENGTTRQTINANVYPSAMVEDPNAVPMPIILAITVLVIMLSLPQVRHIGHKISQRWARLEEEEEEDDELEEGDLFKIVSLIDWMSWAQEHIEKALYLIMTSAWYTMERIRNRCSDIFCLGDYNISDGIRKYSRKPFGGDTSSMPPLEEVPPLDEVKESPIVTTQKEGDDDSENLPNRTTIVDRIDFSTDIEPAFLNDSDYPEGWLIYDPLRDLIPKEEADRLRDER